VPHQGQSTRDENARDHCFWTLARRLLFHTTMARAFVAFVSAVTIAACGGESSTTQRMPGPKPIDAPPGAIAVDLPPAEAECTTASAPLAVHKDDRGYIDRLHVTVEALNQDSAFLVDTGSERTFAITTSWGPASTDAVIGCRSTSVPLVSRNSVATAPDGRPQRGMLGADLLAHDAYFDLDLRAGQLSWTGTAPEPPEVAIVVPIEWRNGWLVASGIVVDGKARTLILDTGSPHVFLMGTTPRDGEQAVFDTDGTGASITYYVADGDVTLPGGAVQRIPVDRAADFPTLQNLITSLGGDIDGLLGLSALGDRRLVISKRSLVVDPRP
jgi:hypothetical protein